MLAIAKLGWLAAGCDIRVDAGLVLRRSQPFGITRRQRCGKEIAGAAALRLHHLRWHVPCATQVRRRPTVALMSGRVSEAIGANVRARRSLP
jgi:hypothetical protein